MAKIDKYGNEYYSEEDICDILYKNGDVDISSFVCIDPDMYNKAIDDLKEHGTFSKIAKFVELDLPLEDYDSSMQNNWFMPEEYKTLDIADYILSQCKNEDELQRVGEELILYFDYGLENLLKFMKYFVDTCKEKNIVLGVGRGSSVASYVLYLMGVHRINSLYFGLDINEFLKPPKKQEM